MKRIFGETVLKKHISIYDMFTPRDTTLNQHSDCLTDDTTLGPSESGVTTVGNDTSSDKQTFCYCHGPEEGDMIACDNPDCTIGWFHISCLHMERLPGRRYDCM